MADNPQSVRQPRAQRHTTSCGECRKRKQRCNQGHPCSNCARRFPQPACEYKENKRKDGYPIPNTSTFLLATRRSRDENEKSLPGTQEPLLPIPRSPISVSDAESEPVGLVSWSDVDILTAFPNSRALEADAHTWGAARPETLPTCLPHCRDHSAAFHDAARLLEYTNHSANQLISSLDRTTNKDDVDWESIVLAGAWPETDFHGSNAADRGQDLPVATTRLKADLLQVYAKLLCRFQSTIDGNLDFNSSYHKTYLAFCFQSPLLVNIAVFTAASYMNETNYLDKTMTIAIKGHAIRMLNDYLRSEQRGTGDEAIAGVAQLIADEWYWGAAHDLKAHLRGMRELIRVRGGFNALGLGGLLSKTIIILDYAIAIAFEGPPYLQNDHEAAFSDPNPGPFRLSHHTPLGASMVQFADCSSSLKIHPMTASILDDIRFLISTVTSLELRSTQSELDKVATTSHWILNRIAKLPVHTPDPMSDASITRQNAKGKEVQQSNSPMGYQEQPADPIYQSIRLSALLYARAIVERKPFSEVCSEEQFYELWTTVWRVPLTRWRSLAGVFLWIVVVILPVAATTPHGRFVKSMICSAGMNVGIENWFAASNALRSVLSLQAWLRGGEEEASRHAQVVGNQGPGAGGMGSVAESSSRIGGGHV